MGAVQHQEGLLVQPRRHLPDAVQHWGVEPARGVRGQPQGDQPGPGVEQPGHLLPADLVPAAVLPAVASVQPADLQAGLLGQQQPGGDVGVVTGPAGGRGEPLYQSKESSICLFVYT